MKSCRLSFPYQDILSTWVIGIIAYWPLVSRCYILISACCCRPASTKRFLRATICFNAIVAQVVMLIAAIIALAGAWLRAEARFCFYKAENE